MDKMQVNQFIVSIKREGDTTFNGAVCPLKKNDSCTPTCPLFTKAEIYVDAGIDPSFGHMVKRKVLVYRLLCGCLPADYEVYPGPKDKAEAAVRKLQ